MNFIVKLIVLYIFVVALLFISTSNLSKNKYLMQKLYIFSGIFIFEIIVQTLSIMYKKQLICTSKIILNSFISALLAVFAYSIYNDLVWNSNEFIQKLNLTEKNLLIAALITIFVCFGYILQTLLLRHSFMANDCLNKLGQKKVTSFII